MTLPGDGAGPSATAGGPAAARGEEEETFVVRDRRRLDPETGELRNPAGRPDAGAAHENEEGATMSDESRNTMAEGDDAFAGAVGDDLPGGYQGRHAADSGMPPTSPATGQASAAAGRAAYDAAPKGSDPSERGEDEDVAEKGGQGETLGAPAEDVPVEEAPPTTDGPSAGDAGAGAGAGEHPDTALAEQRLRDLQSLNAEYVNYKRRVDRDREVEKDRAVAKVIESMVPVLDEIHLARQHGELESGPFAKIAEKLEGVLARHGVERYGQPGDVFDPKIHEAVMHTQAELAPGTTETTVVQVMQPGYKLRDQVVRAALVAVADPQ